MKKSRLVVVLIACFAVIACVLTWYLSFYHTISVSDGISVEYSGVNGHGSIAIVGDVPSSEGKEAYRKLLENRDVDSSAMVSSLQCVWQNEDGSELEQGSLSNGDTVVYTCLYDEDAGKKIGYRFRDLKKSFTVKMLPEGNEIDLFDGIEVGWYFENDSMSMKIQVVNEEALAQQFHPVYDLNLDGGVATVNVVSPTADELLEYGYYTDAYTKTYDVGTQPERIVDLNDSLAIDAAYQVTLPLLEKAVTNCGSVLNSQGTLYTINGYEYARLERAYGDSLDVIYNVYASGRTLIRGYSVDVFRFADGSYHAYTKETEETTSCEITPYYVYWMK